MLAAPVSPAGAAAETTSRSAGPRPRIIAAFAYRYEPDWLIDDLREDLSWVDGFTELDDRDRSDV